MRSMTRLRGGRVRLREIRGPYGYPVVVGAHVASPQRISRGGALAPRALPAAAAETHEQPAARAQAGGVWLGVRASGLD
jgi:hypothetical protein